MKNIKSLEERINTVKRHLDFSIEWKGETLGLLEMRRHYTNYFRGIENFKKWIPEVKEKYSPYQHNYFFLKN